MSDISSETTDAAVERDLLAAISDCEGYCRGVYRDISKATVEKVARALRERLAADRAEREDRAKPVDAEWLGSVVSGSYMPEYKMFIAQLGDPLREVAIVDAGNGWNAFGWRCVNRGQLLDLLRILKGGEA